MSLNKIALAVEEKLNPVITQMGFEIVDVEYIKKGDTASLTIFIDIPRGVTLDDCEAVHRAIDPILDELNPTGEEPYTLNVSSPGLDRPFVRQRDFERNYGKPVELKLYAPMQGKKLFEGILIERSQHTVIISVDGNDLKLENSKVAFVRPLVKFE